MAKVQSIGFIAREGARKKTRQGQGNGTKFSTRVSSKRFKKKYRGQGR